MRRADLRGACLRGANVSLADLTGADFREGQIGLAHPTKGLDLLRTEARSGQLDQVSFAAPSWTARRWSRCPPAPPISPTVR